MPDFHFGRIDVRFAVAVRRCCAATGFRIIEINGAGSEATHVWDPRTTLREAWRAQFPHYGDGVPHRCGEPRARPSVRCGLRAMYRLWRRQNG